MPPAFAARPRPVEPVGAGDSDIASATTRSSRELIADARDDPAFDERNDVLALMLQARYEDGSPISDDHVADELLTLLAAGHETTATTLAWAVERLRRHPRLLSRLTDGGRRGRIGAAAGHDLGGAAHPAGDRGHRPDDPRHESGWASGSFPKGHAVIASISLAHASERNFADAEGVQPGPVRRQPAGHPHLDSVRRRGPPLHRCRVRQHGDERDAANAAARVRVRHHLCRQASAFTPAAWRPHPGAAAAPSSTDERCGSKSDDPADDAAAGVGMTPREASARRRRARHRAVLRTGRRPERPADRADRRTGTAAARSWPTDFATALAGRGYRVTRFDNRDVGRSTHMDFPPPNPLAILRGGNHPRQYHLGDMARDTVGLLDALGYRDAHLVGISMGGMIAQTVAAHYPGPGAHTDVDHVDHGRAAASAVLRCRRGGGWRRRARHAPAPRRWTRAVTMFRHIGSHGFPFDEDAVREQGRRRRGIATRPAAGTPGSSRASSRSGDRTAELRQIDVPTLVIHGDRDRMVHPTGGAATARAIPAHGWRRSRAWVTTCRSARGGALIDLITDHTASGIRPTTPNSRSKR